MICAVNYEAMAELFEKDLFEPSPVASSESLMKRFAFLERTRFTFRLDQVIVLMIGLIVINVMIFTVGVEKGKEFAVEELRAERSKHEQVVHELSKKIFTPKETQQVTKKAPVVEPKPVAKPEPKKEPVKVEKPKQPAAAIQEVIQMDGLTIKTEKPSLEKPKGQSGKYTIQSVTYTAQTAAEKYLKKLQAKGHQGFIIPSGKYLQVCVDAYESRQQASDVLRRLKTSGIIPKDAYIRTIP